MTQVFSRMRDRPCRGGRVLAGGHRLGLRHCWRTVDLAHEVLAALV
jgi:hypothetical protein